jgi:hypothetical protein
MQGNGFLFIADYGYDKLEITCREFDNPELTVFIAGGTKNRSSQNDISPAHRLRLLVDNPSIDAAGLSLGYDWYNEYDETAEIGDFIFHNLWFFTLFR